MTNTSLTLATVAYSAGGGMGDIEALELYPSKSFIKFYVRNQLTADAQGESIKSSIKRIGKNEEWWEFNPIDGENKSLFDEELLQGLFFSVPNTPSSTEKEAREIEVNIALKVIDDYRRLKGRKSEPEIVKLNELLN